MRAGQLRHLVDVYRSVETEGDKEPTFEYHSTRPASVEPLSGRDAFEERMNVATVTHSITMRWFDGLKPSWKLTWVDRRFEIVSALNVGEMNREWSLICAETVQ